MIETVYFDNSATTELSHSVKEEMIRAMECYGNPSSLHALGVASHTLLQSSRKEILETLGVRGFQTDGRLVFTSCGTEADSLALFGTAYAKERRKGGRILSTDCEHPAVENALKKLEKSGFTVVRLSTKNGIISEEELKKSLTKDTFLVSVMTVNNETGARFDIENLFRIVKNYNPDIVTHTDCVQGYLKDKILPEKSNIDLLTISAHKIHGPKGIGALYLSNDAIKRKDLTPFLVGGGQENGMRSGTENLVGIAGFAKASKDGFLSLTNDIEKMVRLRTYAEEQMSQLPVKLHIPSGKRAPHILNFALPDIKSETMLHALSQYGICLSAGSACSSHDKKISPSLLAFGISPEEVNCSLRVSFSANNTKDEIDYFVEKLKQETEKLVPIHHTV